MKSKFLKRVMGVALAATLAATSFATAFAANEPVIDPNKEVSFTLTKFDVPLDKGQTGPDVNGNGNKLNPEPDYARLEGIEFTAYRLGNIDTPMPATPPSDLSTYPNFTMPATNAQGVSTVTINTDRTGTRNQNGKPETFEQGLFYVVEKDSTIPPHITTKTPSFYAYMPMTQRTTRTEWLYDINVYPKNASLLGAVLLEKYIDGTKLSKENGGYATFNLQKDVSGSWKTLLADGTYGDATEANRAKALQTSDHGNIYVNNLLGIPADPGEGTKYQFVETIPPVGYKISGPVGFTIEKNGFFEWKDEASNSYKFYKSAYELTKAEDKRLKGEEVKVDVKNTKGPKKQVDGQENKGIKVGDTATFTITDTVPADIATATKYNITDDLDPRLDITKATAELTVKSGATTLVEDTDYKLTVTPNDKTAEPATGGKVVVSYVETGFGPSDTLKSLAGKEVSITFKSKINELAGPSGKIINKAISNVNDKDYDTNDVNIYYGGIKFKKIDGKTNNALAGAVFGIFASEQDYKDKKTPIQQSTSADGTGFFTFEGLAYGEEKSGVWPVDASTTYYVGEIQAPEGYELQTKVAPATINATSWQTTQDTPVVLKNNPITPLPITGGVGTVLLTVVGIALIAGAAFVIIRAKKVK